MKNTSTRARAATETAAKSKENQTAKSSAKPAVKKNAAASLHATQKVEPKNKFVVKSTSAAKPKALAARAGSTPSVKAPLQNAKPSMAAKSATETTAAQSVSVKVSSAKVAKVAMKTAATKTTASATATGESLRATKKRAPKDLAAQYGENEKVPREIVEAKAPRKRRDAAARARLQSVIAPDDALLLRLARAGAISSSLAPEGAVAKPLRAAKTRRSRQWEAHCGKCGKSAFYRASAALCSGCGTILVREQSVA